MAFAHFDARFQTGEIPNQQSYEVEQDYLEWDLTTGAMPSGSSTIRCTRRNPMLPARLLQRHNPPGGRQQASDPVECCKGETTVCATYLRGVCMLPLVESPEIVRHDAPCFPSVVSPEACEPFQRDVSGLRVSENKTGEGINRLFVSDVRHQRRLNRL